MQITRIEISNRRLDPLNRRDEALVSFHATNLIMRVLAHAPRAATALEFAQDALRQLRRMPEFRAGGDVIEFSALGMTGIFNADSPRSVLDSLYVPPH